MKKREELESTVSVLQQHVKICQNQIKEMQQANEEFEKCGKRLCVRTDGFPKVDNETSDEVLDRVKSLIKETSCDISDVVIDRAHRIGKVSMIKKQMFVVKLSLYILQLLGAEQCFVSMIKKQMFVVKVSLYILQLLGTEQCFTVAELI